MEIIPLKIQVSESIGAVSAEIVTGKDVSSMLVLAHGAGAGMNHSFMKNLSHELAQRGMASIRFNFPFTEGKKKRPDPAPIAERTIESVIEYAKNEYQDLHLFAGGKSFGGRMTSQLISRKPELDVKGLIFFGFPLHPMGKPSTDRAKHLPLITIPMLFIQGTKDALADMGLLTNVLKDLPTSKLSIIEGADHGFLISKKEQTQAVAEAAVSWADQLF